MNDNCIETIKEYETLFSDNQYDGSGKSAFVIEEGTIPIMVSAPHAINHFREGHVKWADMYTGGIARYLHEETGCHLIYSCMFTESDPNFDLPETNRYQKALREFVEKYNVLVLLDLHGASKKREYAVEMGTAPEQNQIQGVVGEEDPSLHEYKFISELIQNLFEANFKLCPSEQKEVWKNRIFDAGDQNTVTKYISKNTNTACIQLEINETYRNPANQIEFAALIKSLKELIDILQSIDWSQEIIKIPQI